MKPYLNNPFFWAFISMFALVAACSVVGSKKIGRHPFSGWIIVSIISLGRIILALPFVEQPRFYMDGFNVIVGTPIFAVGAFLGVAPCFLIKPVTIAEKSMEFVTSSFYKYTRNPIYLGEILWCLGWSIIHGSVIGVLLVPIWWAGFLFLTMIEEESLENALGSDYLNYKDKIRGRIIPGIPI